MTAHATAHCKGILIEYPAGDLLRVEIDGRDAMTLDARECAELREILDYLQPQFPVGTKRAT